MTRPETGSSFAAWLERHSTVLVALLALVLVPLGSAPAIFGNISLYLDDSMRYIWGLENRFPWYIADRNFLRALVMWPCYRLLALSPDYARWIITFGFMAPLSVLFFVLLRAMRLPIIVAIGAALLPNLLPGQEMIPSYIDGSYHVPALLMSAVPSLVCVAYAIRASSDLRSLPYGALAVMFWAFGRHLTDSAVFLAPAALFFVFFLDKSAFDRRRLTLGVLFAAISVYDFYAVLLSPDASPYSQPKSLTLQAVLDRVSAFYRYATPFAQLTSSYEKNWMVLAAATVGLVAVGLVLALTRTTDPVRSRVGRRGIVFIYIFATLWACFGVAPFLTMSQWFMSRYAHTPAFGVAILLSLASVSIASALLPRWRVAAWLPIVALLAISTATRHKALTGLYGSRSAEYASVRAFLAKRKFPLDAQIVLTPNFLFSNGWYNYSCGVFRYLTGRPDITGLHGDELHFYDPFATSERAFVLRMRGLDLSLPVFLFRREGAGYVQKEYALQWLGNAEGNWTIHQLDPNSGMAVVKSTGVGYAQYEATLVELEKQGLQADDIMWGGRIDPQRISPTVN